MYHLWYYDAQDRAQMEDKVTTLYLIGHLKEGLVPLTKLDTGMSKRRQHSRLRIDTAWGEEWTEKLNPIMPKYPAETFLRRLAVFAESNDLDWSEAFFKDQIEARKHKAWAPKTNGLLADI